MSTLVTEIQLKGKRNKYRILSGWIKSRLQVSGSPRKIALSWETYVFIGYEIRGFFEKKSGYNFIFDQNLSHHD